MHRSRRGADVRCDFDLVKASTVFGRLHNPRKACLRGGKKEEKIGKSIDIPMQMWYNVFAVLRSLAAWSKRY